MDILKEGYQVRKESWEKGIYVNIIPLVSSTKLSDVMLEINVRGNIIKGKDVYSQKDPQALYDKIDEIYKWACKNY